MEDDQTRKIIAVLEEIRGGQKEALARQAETMALLRERIASAQERSGRVDQLLAQAKQSQANHRACAQGGLAAHPYDLPGAVVCA
jgi:hypothetical protein